MRSQLFGLEFCVLQLDSIYHHQDYEKCDFLQKIQSL